MWIKICGLQQQSRAKKLTELSVDAVGINRYDGSSRFVSGERARNLTAIVKQNSDDTDVVGVYVNESMDKIEEDLERIDFDVVQLHGDESPRFVDELNSKIRTIKAFRIGSDFLEDELKSYDCWAYLMDAYHPEKYGGTGDTAPWLRIQDWTDGRKLILAGGLNSGNVNEALRTVQPWGLDACSGVENNQGYKDIGMVKKLIENAQI